MMRSRICVLSAVLALAVSAPSCRLFHRSAKTAPPPPRPSSTGPATAQPGGTGAQESEKTLPAPPQIPPQKPDLSQTPPVPAEKLPPPPRRRKHAAPAHENTETPPPAQPPVPPAEQAAGAGSQAPVRQLEQLLSPEQAQVYNEAIDRSIQNARQKIAALRGHRLTGEQKTYLDRIRAFIDQATEARKTDLFRAKSLAERASVLAEDLLRSIQ